MAHLNEKMWPKLPVNEYMYLGMKSWAVFVTNSCIFHTMSMKKTTILPTVRRDFLLAFNPV